MKIVDLEWLLLLLKGVFFMSIEQEAQFMWLEVCFRNRRIDALIKFFKTQNIHDENIVDMGCYDFYKEIHAHNLEDKFVNFTFIYKPPIDQNMYGIKDAEDIIKQKQKDGEFVFEVPINKAEMTEERIMSMVAFANHLGLSMYMSVADYIRRKRVSENLYGVSSIILDLDTYNTTHEYDTDKELLQEMQPIFDRIGIEPSLYINSGHGSYIVFSFNNVNLSVPEMQKLYKETVKKLIFQFKDFGADPKCCDITRVFRVPGNINPKTGKKSYIVEHFDRRTTLSELASAVGICKGKTVQEKKKKNKQQNFQMFYKSIIKSKYTKVNMQRDKDFNTFLEMRNYDIEGYRNIFFHLMSINCLFLGMDEQETTTYLNDINNRLVAPYDGLDAVIRYAKSNYETYEEGYDGAIKYKNRTIVDLLCITEEEQKSMKQLIGQEEADRRIAESTQRKIEKKQRDSETKNKQLKDELMELRYKYRLDNSQIAQYHNLDERTVTSMIGKTPKFVTIGRVDTKQKVFLCCLEFMTNAEIAEKLNISTRTVQRMKSQLRDEGRIS